jgi:acetylornithine deacetylase/succinyl-diaminopimelate desuccinylase-like protein
VLDNNPLWHAMLRTTCVATMLSAGHATNALPQRASANINCRIFPGVSRGAIRDELQRIAGDPTVSVTITGNPGPVPPVAPLTAQILDPVKKVAAQLWPGVPVVPGLEPGGSDAVYLDRVGVPTYGITGILVDPDGGHIHGLNERVRVRSVYDGRTFLYRLVKLYANQ